MFFWAHDHAGQKVFQGWRLCAPERSPLGCTGRTLRATLTLRLEERSHLQTLEGHFESCFGLTYVLLRSLEGSICKCCYVIPVSTLISHICMMLCAPDMVAYNGTQLVYSAHL